MDNSIFHNSKSIEKKLDVKEFSYLQKLDKNKIVDINNLLNRVKVSEKDEKKQRIIFFSFGILLLTSMGIFVSIIR
tara:strand:- start:244 stop:471 length:228 start_codon:yes stop_codon:yes gene_type:complete